jgi:hypothetical protein
MRGEIKSPTKVKIVLVNPLRVGRTLISLTSRRVRRALRRFLIVNSGQVWVCFDAREPDYEPSSNSNALCLTYPACCEHRTRGCDRRTADRAGELLTARPGNCYLRQKSLSRANLDLGCTLQNRSLHLRTARKRRFGIIVRFTMGGSQPGPPKDPIL